MMRPTIESERLTNTRAIVDAVSEREATFAALAAAWQAFGAQGLAVQIGARLFYWPKSARAQFEDQPELVIWEPLTLEDGQQGRIGLTGLSGPNERIRLRAEAGVISRMLYLEVELDTIVQERTDRARLQAEVDVTASIQLQLLPHTPPKVKGVEIFASSLPAAQVGGDFYNYNLHKQGPLVFAVGDVSGKGLPASLLMAMTRIVMHGAARFLPLSGLSPKAILDRVNGDLYEDFTEVGMFATVFTGCYDPKSRQLMYANAGHSPVIFCPFDAPARLLEADGPAVGVLPVDLSENFSLTFRAGDLLVIATDGFSEASNPVDEMFGYERLLILVKELAPLSAAAIGNELFRAIKAFSAGTEQNDDQTLFILKGVAP